MRSLHRCGASLDKLRMRNRESGIFQGHTENDLILSLSKDAGGSAMRVRSGFFAAGQNRYHASSHGRRSSSCVQALRVWQWSCQ